jgi:hypothetical protein
VKSPKLYSLDTGLAIKGSFRVGYVVEIRGGGDAAIMGGG